MEDGEIIELYWRRDEAAIAQSEKKYGAYCRAVICRILQLPEDVEECLVDTWMAAWNAMPPQRPTVLRTFLGRLSRNLSINRALHDKARKRGGGEVTAALEELREIGGGSAEEAVEQAELGRLIDRFLRRYWFLDSVEEIARRYGLRGGSVKTRLHRTRKKLREYLKQEGYAL